ncbi:MAG: endoribonuclease MazF [Acidobacteriota bacterium]
MPFTRNWQPRRGDIVWLHFTPQAGHEQAGRRPALVISPDSYNSRVGLMLACPITTQIKGYPFEIALPKSRRVSGVVLADQVKSLDWRARTAELIEHAGSEVVKEVLAKLRVLLN